MTNKEAMGVLDTAGEGRTEADWNEALDIAIKTLENQEKYKKKIDLMDRKISCLYCLCGLSTVLYITALNTIEGNGSMDTFCTGWALGCLSSLLIMIVYDWRRRHID